MPYRITSMRLLVRETGPARLPSALGKKGLSTDQRVRVTSPICHLHLVIRDDDGNQAFGCSADRLSVRWLDKRPGRSKGLKLRELVALLEQTTAIYQSQGVFDTPFGLWHNCHDQVMAAGRKANQQDLTSTYVSSLFERAVIDGVCRLEGISFAQALKDNVLGIDLNLLNHHCRDIQVAGLFNHPPQTRIEVRHTVGTFDPLTRADIDDGIEINDDLPVSLDECIDVYGLRCFKIKISGDPDHDLKRLDAIWQLLPRDRPPIVTLDANEAYEDLAAFEQLVSAIERDNLAMFQHISFIEQPLPRSLALSDAAGPTIRRVGERKPVIIDESDGTLDAFQRARVLGYAGTSHKNCKGVYKSIGHYAWIQRLAEMGETAILSGEDLQNLPIVPLHQDLAVAGCLRIPHVERNGHHYNRGLSILSARDKRNAARNHRDLYAKYRGEHYLRIVDGAVETASLHGKGFGVVDEPDWRSMEPLDVWVKRRYPTST